jgi:hypothetical protein
MKALITAFALLSFVAASTVPLVAAKAQTQTEQIAKKKTTKKKGAKKVAHKKKGGSKKMKKPSQA